MQEKIIDIINSLEKVKNSKQNNPPNSKKITERTPLLQMLKEARERKKPVDNNQQLNDVASILNNKSMMESGYSSHINLTI